MGRDSVNLVNETASTADAVRSSPRSPPVLVGFAAPLLPVASHDLPDPTWAEQLRREFPRQTGNLAATLHQIDCRETICHLYLHTDKARDAQAIIASLSEDQLEYEQIADHVQLEDAPMGGTLYEVVVRRDRPTSMPPHVPGAARAYALAEQALEGIE